MTRRNFAKLIGGNYRWIAPLALGFSPRRRAPPALQPMLACWIPGIDQVGGRCFHGWSLLCFCPHPHRIKSLVMISAASHAIPPALVLSCIQGLSE
jgi:hypothetical protein